MTLLGRHLYISKVVHRILKLCIQLLRGWGNVLRWLSRHVQWTRKNCSFIAIAILSRFANSFLGFSIFDQFFPIKFSGALDLTNSLQFWPPRIGIAIKSSSIAQPCFLPGSKPLPCFRQCYSVLVCLLFRIHISCTMTFHFLHCCQKFWIEIKSENISCCYA